jgi:hypothetical protein
MKKRLMVGLLTGGLLAAMLPGLAVADSENAAGHLESDVCGTPFGFVMDLKVVENNNVLIMVCTGEVNNPSGEAQREDYDSYGFQCGIPGPDGSGDLTADWFAQMSASGRVTMVCRAESTRL